MNARPLPGDKPDHSVLKWVLAILALLALAVFLAVVGPVLVLLLP